MKKLTAVLGLVVASVPGQVLAEVDPSLCSEVLSRPSIGVADEYPALHQLYEAWTPERAWQFDQELPGSYVSVAPAATRNFKITVAEESAEPRESKSLLQIDCPVPSEWRAEQRPKISVAYPSAVEDDTLVTAVKEAHAFKGFYLTTVSTSRESLVIFPLWRLLEAVPQGNIELPPYITRDKVEVVKQSLSSDLPSAVRAFRMSEDPDIGKQKLWHLILEQAPTDPCSHFEVDKPSSEFFNLGIVDATGEVCQIETLKYWNAETKRLINCSNTANYSDPNHCARVNMQSYGGIFEKVKARKAFYVQLLVKMGSAWVLPTFRVDAAGITLVRQESLSQLRRLNLPIELDW